MQSKTSLLRTVPRNFLDPRKWLKGLIGAIIRPRPRLRLWKWLDRFVVIPERSGGPNPGRLRTGRFAPFQGLYDLSQRRGVHFITLVSSARAGKTLFCICIMLYWLAERFGNVVWLDPTRNSARKLVREEIEEFLLKCQPVRLLAIITKKFWTTLEKSFRGRGLRIIGSGAEADLHGFNATLAIINELDRCVAATNADAASDEKIVARTRLFAATRLILRNSTPGDKGECSPIWLHLLAGSQHYCYLPCPHCSADKAKAIGNPGFTPPEEVEPGRSPRSYDPTLAGWQRLTFWNEKKLVPFDEELNSLRGPEGELPDKNDWREEVTGRFFFEPFGVFADRPRLDDPTQTERVRVGWNRKGLRDGTTYQCAHCQREIPQASQGWMLNRYRWISHNPIADDEHISAHIWAGYSPFETWGIIAEEFIQAKGNLGLLIKFQNLTLGLPFIRTGSAIKEDDLTRVISRCAVRYMKGQIPLEAEQLVITVDRQATEMWYVIRAYGIMWDLPDQPTWSALVDWGSVVSWEQILELCGVIPDPQGNFREYSFVRTDGTIRSYVVTAGLVDCGFEQEQVWNFCLENQEMFSPTKGGDATKTGGNLLRINQVMDGNLDLVWYWSDYFAADLYYSCIREGKSFSIPVYWFLPTDIDDDYKKQLTDEYQTEENGKRIWTTRTKTNHLGDCEKLQRVGSGQVEVALDMIRAAAAKEAKSSADKEVAR